MKIFEVLDKPLPYKLTDKEQEEELYTFRLPDRRTVTVIFYAPEHLADGIWEVLFKIAGDQRQNQYAPTGDGGEIKIFSTMSKIILDFLNSHEEVFKLILEAEESNRKTLYARMLKRLVKPPYHFKQQSDGTCIIYNQERMNRAEADQ